MRSALKPFEGIHSIQIETGNRAFSIDHDPDKAKVDEVLAALKAKGEGAKRLQD